MVEPESLGIFAVPVEADRALGTMSLTAFGSSEISGSGLDLDIRRVELELGIQTSFDRIIEGALAVDLKFLQTAIILDQPNPERLFGDDAWLGHLKARQFCRSYGPQVLTVEFALAVYQCFLDKLSPGRVAEITDGHGGLGGQFVNGHHVPIRFTDAQIAVVNENPLISYKPVEDSDVLNVGYIEYSSLPAEARQAYFEEICEDYNRANRCPDVDPYVAAATMQRRLVSLHPFKGDFTGRTSRALMNWALENSGMNASIVSDPDADLYVSEEDWIGMVKAGSERYAEYMRRASAGATSYATLFGLEQAILRYRAGRTAASLALKPGEWHDHMQSERFLTELGVNAK